MKYIFIAILIFINSNILFCFEKNFEIIDTVSFNDTFVGEIKEFNVSLKNLSETDILIIEKLVNYQNYEAFEFNMLSKTVLPNENLQILNIKFKPTTNIQYIANIFLEVIQNNNKIYYPLVIVGQGNYRNEFYKTTNNLWGEELFAELKQLISNHNSFSYKDARKLLWTGPDRIDGFVECFYTGRKKEVSDEPDFTIIDQEGFNTEHIWPRAYGADDEPELSDMFHICPTFKTANTKRDNYPFDYVVSNVSYQDGGSKLGKNANGDIVFEVRDKFKGNIARSMFYFALRYGNKKDYLSSQEQTLREWHFKDLPDELESNRNEFIFQNQKNRNPLIDYPELLNRMPSISKNGGKIPLKSEVKSISNQYIINISNNLDKINFDIYFYNDGNLELNSDIKLFNDNNFYVNYDKTNLIIPQYSYQKINIEYVNKNNNNDSLILRVEYSNNKVLENKIFINKKISNVLDFNSNILEIRNNPSDNNQIIYYQDKNLNTVPDIYLLDILGNIIYKFNTYNQINDNLYIINLNNYKINLTNGTYIFKILDDNYIFSNKLIIVK